MSGKTMAASTFCRYRPSSKHARRGCHRPGTPGSSIVYLLSRGNAMIPSDRPIPSNSVTLTPRQKRAMSVMMRARSVEEGCRLANIAKQTWYNWMKREEFRQELAAHREAAVSEAFDRLKSAVTSAIEGLTGLVDCEDRNVRLRACNDVLDRFMKVREMEETERRLCALENTLLKSEREGS